MANRHLSRSIVLQTLFEWDFLSDDQKNSPSVDEEIKIILKRNLEEFSPGVDYNTFASSLLNEVLKNQKIIDEIIEKAAPDWPIKKISVIDRNVLRIGICELLFSDREQVPSKVAIDEAIELAKSFGGENSGKFVNGVLGAVYKELGEPGKDQKSTKNKKNNDPIDIGQLPIENLGGAIIYYKKPTYLRGSNDILLAFVHDVFSYWTLSKGRINEGEDIEEGTKRVVKKEIGLDIIVKEKLGENQYVATHPEKGKILKKVSYFLASSEYKELELENSGGLDGARWFSLDQISELRIYSDIIPFIEKAVRIIVSK